MNRYETVFIATPVLGESQVAEIVSKFQSVIAENGGNVESTEQWGLKKLAYPIQKKTTGYYFLIEFTSETGKIVETLETAYRRDERVIRFLTVTLDKHATEWAIKRRQNIAAKQQQQQEVK